MNAFILVDRLFSEAIVERLGWVLVHSLWQFTVVALLAAVISTALSRRSATARYGVLVVAMAVTVVTPCVTWMFIPASGWASALRENTVAIESQPSNASEDESSGDAKLGPTGSEIALSLSAFEKPTVVDLRINEQTRRAYAQPLAEAWTNILRPWFTWIVGGWVIGVLLCSLRPLLGWRMLRRLRRVGISPPSDEVVAALQKVSQRLGMRRVVQVLHSTLATGPLVVGYLRPVVLLPVSLVTNIPMSQLEAILAHELAHIRRHDFMINLAQTLVETLFFYHPAVWWLSRRIRVEREHCCDDLVINVFNNRIDYGRALLAIEQLQSQRTVLALGVADGSLLGRIRRIVELRSMHRSEGIERGSTALLSLVSLCLLVILSTAWTLASQDAKGGADVKNSRSPLADMEFGQGELVSGKDGPKDPTGKNVEVVPVTEGNILSTVHNTETASSPEAPDSIQGDLPTGVRVKLAGVTTPPVLSEEDFRRLSAIRGVVAALIVPVPTAENLDKRQWWSGDGMPLDKPPADGEAWTVRKDWEDGRLFAFEFSGLANRDSKLDIEMFHLRPGKPPQAVMLVISKSESDPGKRIIMASIAPDTDADSATLELRVGTAESAIVKLDAEGRRIDSLATEATHHSDSMKQIIENIKLLRITQNGDKVEVWTRPININHALASVMVSVLDNTGKLHSTQAAYSINNEQLTLVSNVRAESIREIHFEIRSLNHSLTFENVSRKPGKMSDVKVTVAPLPTPRDPIQARLPNGSLIELLGVSTPPIASPSNDKRDWWKADGTTMNAAPISRDSVHVGADRTDGREFVFRISEMAGEAPIHVTLNQRFKDGQPYEPEGNGWSMGSTQSGHLNGDPKAIWQAMIEQVAGPVGDADSATLEIRIGSGTDAEMLFDAKGQRTNADSKDEVWQLAAVKRMAERVEVLRTGPHEAGFAIWTKPFSSSTDEGNLDVALIDVAGKQHIPFASGSDGKEAYRAYQIKPEDIDKFVVRLRPFQYLATFENVSLKPGRKSDVRISVNSVEF